LNASKSLEVRILRVGVTKVGDESEDADISLRVFTQMQEELSVTMLNNLKGSYFLFPVALIAVYCCCLIILSLTRIFLELLFGVVVTHSPSILGDRVRLPLVGVTHLLV
jgi:hypothetical protein